MVRRVDAAFPEDLKWALRKFWSSSRSKTLFSLPFVLIGFVLADKEFGSEASDGFWIIFAAVGARGLAMVLIGYRQGYR